MRLSHYRNPSLTYCPVEVSHVDLRFLSVAVGVSEFPFDVCLLHGHISWIGALLNAVSGAVTLYELTYCWPATFVGFGMPRPPNLHSKAKRSLSSSVVPLLPVSAGKN